MNNSAPNVESPRTKTVQRIVKIRRDYNTWVANETIEDYALRFTPRTFRKWSIFRVANTAFGAIAFLVLEAIGGTLAVHYGFINAFWAILAVSLIIFLSGLPISYYAARHGVDMDLLTRGAGFGYIGSTISSFIYASFTFILFALEAAIMAYALELYFGLPLWLGYLASALAVVPLVTHGVTLISRIQMVSQPLWLLLMALPFIAIAFKRPDLPGQLLRFAGTDPAHAHFNTLAFGAATAVGVALIPQIGEQVDFLRFMPPPGKKRLHWHLGVLAAGPGWAVVGALKMLAGALLALLALEGGASLAQAVNPTHMYLAGFSLVGAGHGLALLATVVFVVVSQVKINMTNAYAGSLAWSNFFARLTHSHPGRVVWACFNALIAVLLMELNVFQALGQVLGLFSNIAIAWIAAVVADLVINKPLGLSPAGIEFRRAYLYDINPVGVGAMLLTSLLSVAAFTGLFGATAQAFSALIALATAFATAPAIACLTGGRYYIARQAAAPHSNTCSICEKSYEAEDMAHCPAYQGPICSLCCCLDARCDDACKPHARLSVQWQAAMHWLLPKSAWPYLVSGLGYYLLLLTLTLLFLAGLLGLLYLHEGAALLQAGQAQLLAPLRLAFLKIFGSLLLVSAIVAWWLVLNREGRRVAQEEAQQARKLADQANQAKSRYIAGISHEIRTPLNSILGYAQLLEHDPAMPPHRQQAIRVIRGSGEHLLSLIEGTLDIARIEGGRLSVDLRPLEFATFIAQLVLMFEQQAASKALAFRYEVQGSLPALVRADRKRLGQILINILGNAVKFTSQGSIVFRLRYQRDMAHFEVEDSGPGIFGHELERIFEPFARGSAGDAANCGGTGLGLPISKLLTELMGGELTVRSTPGTGSVFGVRLLLPRLQAGAPEPDTPALPRSGYAGARRRILVVDNDPNDRELLAEILTPLGFIVGQAASGQECLQYQAGFTPDLILMDLAMPGMDGWEASHLLRTGHGCTVPIGIVSANAYDKGLPNPAGIGADDFFTKPVQLAELLDWIGRRLQLDWIVPAAAAASAPPPGLPQLPPPAQLATLRAQVRAGYMRGIKQQLDVIAALGEPYLHFVAIMRAHAQRFDLEAMAHLLEQGASHATND
ncbi:ATP-binding protein [Duganella sp. Root198D2]|uniref:ATP-binding protein n=1 Tax=Duganella sp. Root198D2 TaxID=1736489 RepID=UPI00070D2847|nr:ATP-binding protein [Duganella sp. Root198D2]KRC03057.1 ATPase [Duganella sp. Root198D2]